MLSTFYKYSISKYDKYVPFIQYEILNDLIDSKGKISNNEFDSALDYLLVSDMTDIEHYVNSNSKLDLDEYMKINVFFFKCLFKDLNKNSRNFLLERDFFYLLDIYDNEYDPNCGMLEIDKQFIKYMHTQVSFYNKYYDDREDFEEGLLNQCGRNYCIVM
jgi:hypothetical protein